MRTVAYTCLALLAFAANSVLCRVAVNSGAIDAASFLTIRIASGAAALFVVARATRQGGVTSGSWTSAGILFMYGVPFSFAYARLTAGTGALILFGSVQIAMMTTAVWKRDPLGWPEWVGLGLALAGLLYLTSPGLAAPPLTAAALMVVAGIFWGLYSLRGRTAASALRDTTGNFVRCLPLVLVVSAVTLRLGTAHVSATGAGLAVASGSVASGLGYVLWYRALGGLTRTRAAVVQLAVPVIAAAGGVLLLGELLSTRLVVAAAMILGGIALTIAGRQAS